MESASPFLLLMPSYNQAHYIGDAVRSILAQDDPDWELWIVDNSTDATPEVMRGFNDPRIHYHHLPTRMDPGTCLNWMLERAAGEVFSYVHTDNNLQPAYVRRMRSALRGHPLGLAYCDMRVIDVSGDYVGVFRRGVFDQPRLLSIDTLGVPFAATTKLASQMGGFTASDFADDVRFCVGAYGLAHYVHLPEPLLDYRLHGGSRTEEAGGGTEMQRVFASLMLKLIPSLQQRGTRPIEEMERKILSMFEDLDLAMEDHWYRFVSRHARKWWDGAPRVDPFFFAGLVSVPGFSSRLGRPPRGHLVRNAAGRICAYPWEKRTVRHYLRQPAEDLRRTLEDIRNMLPIWAPSRVGIEAGAMTALCVRSADFRTLWIARQLETMLGWQPLWGAGLQNRPAWLKWGVASGSEPVLDCSRKLMLTGGSLAAGQAG